jgi:hypothetical protein
LYYATRGTVFVVTLPQTEHLSTETPRVA